MKCQHYLLLHLIERSRSFTILHNLYPNKAHVSLYYKKCHLQPLYIYFHNSGCPVSIYSHFSKTYITVSLKQCSSGIFSLENLWKRITQGWLCFHMSPSSFFKTVIFWLGLISAILDNGTDYLVDFHSKYVCINRVHLF